MAHIFGPVPSRRLGRSLGIDLVPLKTCTYDCIYCQLGRTTCKTVEPREYVPIDEALAELQAKLATCPDYITLSGSGEPTLYSRTGELIDRIKGMTDIPIAVLTNGSLLWRPEVRRQLIGADLVIPSLDGGDEAMFQAIDRPHEGINFEKMLNGLIDFRKAFQGQYWLEVVLLAGYNAIEAEVVKLAACAKQIAPDRIQLNTATRPPAEDYAVMVSQSRLEELAGLFDPPAEVIADYRGVHGQSEFLAGRDEVMALLRRRPCSIEGVADGLGMHRNEVVKYLEDMLSRNELDRRLINGTLHYSAKR